MRALFFILVGVGLTLGTIHYLGPDRFMKLYQGLVSTGNEIAAGGGIDTITEKLNAGSEPGKGTAGNQSVAPKTPGQTAVPVEALNQP